MTQKELDMASLGITYQMSLDSFLMEDHHATRSQEATYENALEHLRRMKKCRSWEKKRIIAQQAFKVVPMSRTIC